jgi:O-antigen ligase
LEPWIAANLSARGAWLGTLLTVVFAIPGPADRIFWSVKLGRETDATQGAGFSVVDLMLVATLAVSVWQQTRRPRRIRWSAHVPIFILFAALVGFAMISLAAALSQIPDDQVGAAFKGAVIFVRMAMIFGCVALMIRTPIDLRGMVVGLVLATGALLANGALYTYQHRDVVERLTAGSFGNDLYANLLAVIGLLLAGFTIMPWMNRYTRAAAGIAFLGCVSGILGTKTRTAAIVLVFGMVAVAALLVTLSKWQGIRNGRLVIVGGFATILCLAVVLVASNGRFGVILSELVRRQSVADRLPCPLHAGCELDSRFAIWRGTLSMVHDHLLFGVGPGQWDFFRHAYGVTFATYLDVHNAYLNILVDDGLFVMVAYLLIIAVSVWRGLSTFGSLRNDPRQASAPVADYVLLGFLLIGIVAWLVTDLLNSGSMNLRAQIFYWCLLAISYRAREIFLLTPKA